MSLLQEGLLLDCVAAVRGCPDLNSVIFRAHRHPNKVTVGSWHSGNRCRFLPKRKPAPIHGAISHGLVVLDRSPESVQQNQSVARSRSN